ncbi:MAG: DUF1295 domain-containing protein [Oscillospiraceae bacterium]|nr:DUF1295 domain-containing protein [Oscillospiraceae bacterium]
MVVPAAFWLVVAVAFVISAIGFKEYIWFFSIGYGFAIAGEGVLLMCLYRNGLTLGTALCCVLFVVYGCRLGGYLAYREAKLKSYHRHVGGEIKDSKTIPFFVKVSIWVACAVLYVAMVAPVFYRMHNGSADNLWTWVGAALILIGFVMETEADREKKNAKAKDPHRFVDTGLYRMVRCPNYLGELVLWTGVLVVGFGTLTAGQWVVAILGYIGIVYVMFSGARRLELRQNRTYGSDPEYQIYSKKVPILLPLIPLYSVVKYKWLVA